VWLLFHLLDQVFSTAGLAYSFGLGPATNVEWPGLVRLTTWVLTAELVTLAGWAADFYTGRGPRTRALHGWVWAHVSAPARIAWHTLIAPILWVRDRAYRRLTWRAWPVRPKHRFELAAMCGELVTDTWQGILALASSTRRLQWRQIRKVQRSTPVPAQTTEGLVVDGQWEVGEVLHTWAFGDPDPVPAPREAEETTRA
jgi:hypothetical protein